MSRRWRNPSVRVRRRRFDPPWVGSAVPPPPALPGFRDQAGWRPRWNPDIRRGAFLAVPPAPLVVATPAPPEFLSRAVRLVPVARRGTFQPAPAGARAVTAPVNARRATRGLGARRGAYFPTPPPVPVAAIPPPPGIIESRRPPVPLAVRTGVFTSVPSVPPPLTPPPPGLVVGRRRPAYPTRHGQYQPVSAPVATAPPWINSRRPPLRAPVPAGTFTPVVPAPPVVAPPVVAEFTSPRRAAAYPVRRGQFQPVAVPAATVTRAARRSPRAAVARRGSFLPVPPPGAAPANPAPLPPALHASRRVPPWTPTRRGLFHDVPLQGQVAGPGPLTPTAHATRRPMPSTPVRRGVFQPVPLTGLAPVVNPWPPAPVRQRRTVGLPTRTGTFATPIPTVPVPSDSVRAAIPAAVRARRGVFFPVIPAPVVAAPGVVPVVRSPRRPVMPTMRRGDFQTPPAVSPAVPVVWRRRPQPSLPIRSGAFTIHGRPTPGIPDPIRQTGATRALNIRRGRFQLVVPTLPPPGPGPLPPALRRQPGRRILPMRSGVFTVFPWPSLVAPIAWPPSAGKPFVVDPYTANTPTVVDTYTAGRSTVVDTWTAGNPRIL